MRICVVGCGAVGYLFAATNLLVQNSGVDPLTIGGVVVLLLVVSLVATVVPARRATTASGAIRRSSGTNVTPARMAPK